VCPARRGIAGRKLARPCGGSERQGAFGTDPAVAGFIAHSPALPSCLCISTLSDTSGRKLELLKGGALQPAVGSCSPHCAQPRFIGVSLVGEKRDFCRHSFLHLPSGKNGCLVPQSGTKRLTLPQRLPHTFVTPPSRIFVFRPGRTIKSRRGPGICDY
jgi:hypothetical protein